MENTQKYLTDVLKGHDGLVLGSSTLTQNTEKHLTDLKKEQDVPEQLLNQNFTNTSEWTTILRRQDGSVDFNRNWAEYQKGFGSPNGEFFISLDELHSMTALGAPQELLVIRRDFGNQTLIAKYDHFQIGSELEKYELKELGKYRGDASDDLEYYQGMMFSTYDQDNDLSDSKNCAEYRKGAWWFKDCYVSYWLGPYKSEADGGIQRVYWKDNNSVIKFIEMKIRPKSS